MGGLNLHPLLLKWYPTQRSNRATYQMIDRTWESDVTNFGPLLLLKTRRWRRSAVPGGLDWRIPCPHSTKSSPTSCWPWANWRMPWRTWRSISRSRRCFPMRSRPPWINSSARDHMRGMMFSSPWSRTFERSWGRSERNSRLARRSWRRWKVCNGVGSQQWRLHAVVVARAY